MVDLNFKAKNDLRKKTRLKLYEWLIGRNSGS